MNFSLLNVALFAGGALLIASAIKDQTPRQIIAENVGAVRAPGKGRVAKNATSAANEAYEAGKDVADVANDAYATPYKVAST